MISVTWLKWKKHSYFVCDKKDKLVLKTIKILNIAEHLQALKQTQTFFINHLKNVRFNSSKAVNETQFIDFLKKHSCKHIISLS